MTSAYKTSDVKSSNNEKFPFIDLISDTVSRPTDLMRKAMFEAVVGDDVYDEDPTVNELQIRVAKLFNKEAALFVTTGTMGNLAAILSHCDRRGCEVLMGDQAHTFLWEQGGAAQLGGVHTRTLPTLEDGTFDLELLEKSIRADDVHSPITSLICVENTHNNTGGRVIPMKWIDELAEIAKKHKIRLHMDGARIFNAAAYLKLPVSKITEKFDSVQFCFSKGLGCPVGSMLVGSKDFIHRAKRLRKVFGAAMRQVGVIAAPCMVALDTMVDRLADDHRRTRQIAQGIHDLKCDFIKVDLENLHTNILMIYLDGKTITCDEFMARLGKVTDEEAEKLKNDAVRIRLSHRSKNVVRLVVYYEITDDHVEKIIKKIKYIAEEKSKKI